MIKRYLLFLNLLVFLLPAQAQKLNADEVKQYTEECNDLVAYLQFSLNAIGDNELTPKEKDIIISESYLKFFRDDKVQVEDDLVDDREAVTNKDVQAYLKDVDFFFKNVRFSYKVLSVNLQQDENNQEYFKIHALRTLSGNNLKGDSIYNEQPRYIEVAIDPNLRELKIVSIYTTKINEKEENIKWWNELPISWKEILGKEQYLCDDIEFSQVLRIEKDLLLIEPTRNNQTDSVQNLNAYDSLVLVHPSNKIDSLLLNNDSLKAHFSILIDKNLEKIINRKELDVSGRLDIVHVEPVSKLTELNSLNLSGTLVRDLYPVRNLVHLQDLNVSSTLVNNLDALIYSMSLQNLDISHTKVYTLAPLSNLNQIRSLNISLTTIDDLSPIRGFKQISELRMQNTMVYDLSPLKDLQSLDFIYFDNSPVNDLSSLRRLTELRIISANSTMINNLEPLVDLVELNVLYCDNTEITSLKALDGKEKLSKIYCDNTLLGKKKALDFMSQNPNVLVVYESQKLKKWFLNLSNEWKQIFKKYVPSIDLEDPSKEDLHQVAGISEMDLSNYQQLTSIDPLYQIQNLQKLNISQTNVSSLQALFELRDLKHLDINKTIVESLAPLENNNSLQYLDISNTRVRGLQALREMYSLRKLNIENTGVKNLEAIKSLNGLKLLRADGTQIPVNQFQEFILTNPSCLVIYQSVELQRWWNNLSANWKEEFSQMQNWIDKPTNEELHQLLARTTIKIKENRNIKSIDALKGFQLIEELELIGTQVSNIQSIETFERLKKLNLSQSPVIEFQVLGELKHLEWIDISNTQVDELEFASHLRNLQYLDISGTPVKKLKPLAELHMLETLLAFNTRISSLKEISEIKSLRSLKVYNTKVSSKKVEQFKLAHPLCEVDYF
jgi:hypothetical protein